MVPLVDPRRGARYRLSRSGRSFADFEAQGFIEIPPAKYRKYRKTGFATPSGKVELSSSVLGDLGFDPLPYFRPGPATSKTVPCLSIQWRARGSVFSDWPTQHQRTQGPVSGAPNLYASR